MKVGDHGFSLHLSSHSIPLHFSLGSIGLLCQFINIALFYSNMTLLLVCKLVDIWSQTQAWLLYLWCNQMLHWDWVVVVLIFSSYYLDTYLNCLKIYLNLDWIIYFLELILQYQKGARSLKNLCVFKIMNVNSKGYDNVKSQPKSTWNFEINANFLFHHPPLSIVIVQTTLKLLKLINF